MDKSEHSALQYENVEDLRLAIERESRRPLSDGEWAKVAPNWAAPYDDTDVNELLNAARNEISNRITPTSDERAFKFRRGNQERVVRTSLPWVESFRIDLFGSKQPLFPDSRDVIEPAKWIEFHAEPILNQELNLTVSIPSSLNSFEALVRFSSILTRELDEIEFLDGKDDFGAVKSFVDKSEVVDEIGFTKPPELKYLSVDLAGLVFVKRIPAPRDSTLGRLRVAADQISQRLDWNQHAAVHHLFTCLIPDYPLIRTKSTFKPPGKDQKLASKITLEIRDPESVTEQEVAIAYRRVRENNAGLPWGSTKKRSRLSPKTALAAALVQETPNLSWDERFELWNQRYPNDRYRTVGAMKQADQRSHPS